MAHDHEHEEPSMDELWALTSEAHTYEERTDALMTIAVRLKADEEFWGSIAAAQSAFDIFDKAKDQTNMGHCLLHLGKCFAKLKEFNDALDSFAKAGDCFQSVADDTNRGEALRFLGYVYTDMDKPDEAALVRKDAIALLAASEDFTPAGITALDHGEALGRAGRQSEALESFKLAYKYFQDANDIIGSVRAHDRMAAALIDLGQMSDALDHLRDALALAEYIDDVPRTNWGRYRLGWTLVTVGKYDEALPLLDQAIAGYKAVGNFVSAASCDLQKAHAYNAMGEKARALYLYQTAHAVFESMGDKQSALMAHVNVGENLTTAGNLLKAQECFLEALDEAIEIKDAWLERAIRTRLSEVQLALENPKGALEAIESSNADEWGEDISEKARHLNAQARALIASGKLKEARKLLEKVIELNANQSLPLETARAYEMVLKTLSGASDNEISQITAQAISLYLAAGQIDSACELSKLFMPADNTQAVQMLRREFDQPTLFEVETAAPETDKD
jgi:tetratricopeptide (TPR) repeat protein